MLECMNAEEFYRTIYPNIVGKTGQITIELNKIKVIVKSKDSIGNMLQDWTEIWASKNNIYLRPNPLTQEFPDFYLTESNEDNLLEVKSFDFNAGANFDIANFETYIYALLEEPKKLDASYLIFGYSLINGVLKVEEIWLKKIWELSTHSAEWDLKVQQKKGTIYNIRPVNFISKKVNIAQPFATKQDFLIAVQSVLDQYVKTKGNHTYWLNTFVQKYYDATGIPLFQKH